MFPITIITIVVVALLTVIIFGLAWLGYSSSIKSYKVEIAAGQHDKEVLEMFDKKHKGLVGLILSYIVLALLASLFVVGLVYKINNENITINNKTILVIKSNSMADFYDEQYAETLAYDDSLHFAIGDICIFEKVSDDTELIKGEVYGYKYKNIIVTHRLVDIKEDDTYEFRGDNNSISDPYHVKRSSIIYHYVGKKLPGIGSFVLYAQSYFGIWSIVGMVGVSISSDIVFRKIRKYSKERYNIIKGEENEA